MTKIQMNPTIGPPYIAGMILFLSIQHLMFEFVSYFEIRVSNFTNGSCVNHALRG